MDVIGSEADLMCSVKRRQVFGELFDHRVRHARRADVLSERAGNVQPYKMLPSCRVIEILHAQVAIVVEVLDQALIVKRAKHSASESAHRLRAQRVGITQHEGMKATSVIRNAQGKNVLPVIIIRSKQGAPFVSSQERVRFIDLVVDLSHRHLLV